jgi:predicted transcriptional regulator
MDDNLKLTAKEEEVMNFFWEKGALFVREILCFYDDPRPHFNTISTIVRGLEDKGLLSHKPYGNSYQYFAAISRKDYGNGKLKTIINKYYNSSVMSVVSGLVESEEISIDELRKLIGEVGKGKGSK